MHAATGTVSIPWSFLFVADIGENSRHSFHLNANLLYFVPVRPYNLLTHSVANIGTAAF